MKNNKIREATEKDIDNIVRLHNSDPNLLADDEKDYYENKDIEDYLNSRIYRIFVYELNNQVIGFLISQFYTNYIYLHAIIVDKKHQGKGIGKELLDFLENSAKEKNIQEIAAFTEISNKKMQKIFENRGYKKGKTFFYYSK